MYAWIWRRLPFGLPGKLVGSALLIGLTTALLWYVVFPWAEPLLPFDDVQVSTDVDDPGADVVGPDDPDGGGGQPGDGHDLPYSTESNNPLPTTPDR